MVIAGTQRVFTQQPVAPANAPPVWPVAPPPSVEALAQLPPDRLARRSVDELVRVAERFPEVVACLPIERLAEIGKRRSDLLSMIFQSAAATVPASVPKATYVGTHVIVADSGIKLSTLVGLGWNMWRSKEFRPDAGGKTGLMVDHVAFPVPNAYAQASIDNINKVLAGVAGKNIIAPVPDDGRPALITNYFGRTQAFGTRVPFVDQMRQLPNGDLLGITYVIGADGQPKKYAYVLLKRQA